MLRLVHEPALDRVLVDVVELLPQHLLPLDTLRVRSFLPELVRPVAALGLDRKLHPFQQWLRVVGF